jgi:phosphatidylinositol alpha 1,6-mannosyltransferase
MPSIVIATDTFLPERNGAAVVTGRAAMGLSHRGWRVHVIAPSVPAWVDPAEGIPVDRVPSLGLPFYGSIRIARSVEQQLRPLLDRHRPDVVLCATEFRVGYAAQCAARARQIPVVSTFHTDFEQYATAYRTRIIAAPIRAWLARFHRRSDVVLAPSRAACRTLTSMAVTEPRVWGRCVNTALFRPRPRGGGIRPPLDSRGTVTFLCVARLAREKSVDVVIASFLRAMDRLPNGSARLVIVGDGPLDAQLRAQAGRGLAERGAAPQQILFLGVRDREQELPALYASADAFVFASTTETLGLVVLEAMASGLAVVAPGVGGIAEHLTHDVTGIETGADIPEGLARGMVRLALQPNDRSRLGEAARRHAESIDESRDLDTLDRLLRDLCGRTRQAAA